MNKKNHKYSSAMGKFMKYIGQGQRQYMLGAFNAITGLKQIS